MRTIEVRITGMFVRKDDKNAGVQGEGNATQLHITFDATWDGYGKRLIWRNAQGQDPVSLVLAQPEEDSQQRAYTTPIPAEALKLPGWCSFTVEGYRSGAEGEADSAAFSVRDYLQVLENDSYYSPAQPTPTEAQQILGALGQAVERVDASAQEAESWAVGGTGTRDGEDTDNAKYYAGEAAQSAADALASQEAAGDSEAAAAESAQAAGESAAQAQTAQSKAEAAQGAAESARDAAMEAQQGAQSALSAAQAAQGAAERAQSAAQSSEQRAAESATSAQESARSAQESAAAAQTASAQAQAAQTAAQTASAQAQSAQLVVEEAREDTLAALSAAQAAQEGAEQARDQAQEIVGGDFATRSEAQGYVDSHNASDLSHPDIRQALSGHAASRSNPHGVTAAQAGAISVSEKGAAGGVASLGADGKVPAGQLPEMDYDPSGSAAAVQTALTSHTSSKANPHGVTAAQVGAVPTSRTVNGKALSANISLTAANVGADPAGTASSAVSAHNQDGSAHPALQAKLEGMKTAVTAAYPVAAGQTVQAGDVVDVADGELTVDKKLALTLLPGQIDTAGMGGIAGTCRSSYKLANNLYLTVLTYNSANNVAAAVIDCSSDLPVISSISGTAQGTGISPDECSLRKVPGTDLYIMLIATDKARLYLIDAQDTSNVRFVGSAVYSGASLAGEFAITTSSSSGQYFIYLSPKSSGNTCYILTATISSTGITIDKTQNFQITSSSYALNGFIAFLSDVNGKVFFAGERFPSGNTRRTQTYLAAPVINQETGEFEEQRAMNIASVGNTNAAWTRLFYVFPNDPTQFLVGWNGTGNKGCVGFTSSYIGTADHVGTKQTFRLKETALLPSETGLFVQYGTTALAFASAYNTLDAVDDLLIPSDTKYIVRYTDRAVVYTTATTGPLLYKYFLYEYATSQAIALQSGTAGKSVDIIYSGITDASFITQGQTIASGGVYGAGVLDGVLQVWSNDRPKGLQIETGSYKGTGTYGSSKPNSITFSFVPKIVFIGCNWHQDGAQKGIQYTSALFYAYGLTDTYRANGYEAGFATSDNGTRNASSFNYAKLVGSTLSWYYTGTSSQDTSQMNSSNTSAPYQYLAIG